MNSEVNFVCNIIYSMLLVQTFEYGWEKIFLIYRKLQHGYFFLTDGLNWSEFITTYVNYDGKL